MRWLDSIIGSMDVNSSKLGEIVEDRGAWCVGHNLATEQQRATEQQLYLVRLVFHEIHF